MEQLGWNIITANLQDRVWLCPFPVHGFCFLPWTARVLFSLSYCYSSHSNANRWAWSWFLIWQLVLSGPICSFVHLSHDFRGGRADSFGSLWCIFKEYGHIDCQAGCQGIQAVPLKLCPYALCEPLGRQALLNRIHLYSPEWGKSIGAFGPMVLSHWSKWSSYSSIHP